MESCKIDPNKTIEDLYDAIINSGRNFNMEKIEKAYRFAFDAHKNQKRRSGIPYILHPISVASILVDLGMDTDSICAALLHDVVEDTDKSLQEIQNLFGKDVALLTDGVTKLGKIPFSSKEEEQAENLRKMLFAMADDIRVIIIKLADRIHNMRTIEFLPPQKIRDKSLETMEVYAPIAHRLGIEAIKEEMEDLALKKLDPIGYKEIENALQMNVTERKSFIFKVKDQIKNRVLKILPKADISGRVKSINGIYRKLFMHNKSFEQIYDVYAFRVIVDRTTDCYNVLGIIHDMYTPLSNRFKDYISTPKPNMYQSLHTTVLGREGIPFEVQIRTWDMHYTAEYGIAAHWKYKLGISKGDSLEERLAWIRKMLDNQKDSEDSTEIISNIKTDLVPDEVFVFTPRGDVINLPLHSVVIDFAYAIHSMVGNKMIGAKADGKIVPIDSTVKTGQIIEILTTKDPSHGPSRDWLKLVKTSEARSKIKQWFKKEKRDENILAGKFEIEREFKRASISLPSSEYDLFMQKIAEFKHFRTTDDLYAAIGYGGISLLKIMPKIREEYNKIKKINSNKEINITNKIPNIRKSKFQAVIIDRLDNCLVRFAKCCNPLPGDKIVGFITRGYGVSIHKRDCKNVPQNLDTCEESDRWVNAYWEQNVHYDFHVNLEILTVDRTDVLAEITNQLANMKITINSFSSKSLKNYKSKIYTTITVRNLEHLKTIISKIDKVYGVIDIERA